jgi:hypothetical protein
MAAMKLVVIAAVGMALCVGVTAWAEDEPGGDEEAGTAVQAPLEEVVKHQGPPPAEHYTVKVKAADGVSDQEITAAIEQENARRDPAAQQAAQAAKQKADADAAHAERVAKICDSIPEKAMRDDPSLRKMCQ